MCAINIADPSILDHKCHKNLFNLTSTGVKYLGSMSCSVIYGIFASYLTGVTFHRVNIQRYLLGKICKCQDKVIHIAKYFVWEGRVKLMYCKFQSFPASRCILYCINTQMNVLIHLHIQTFYNLHINKTPLGKPRNKLLTHLLQSHYDQYFGMLGCLVFGKLIFALQLSINKCE